jgi:hypothetical protein
MRQQQNSDKENLSKNRNYSTMLLFTCLILTEQEKSVHGSLYRP